MMAAVNWFCLVLAFAFIKMNVCIKVDPNEIPSGNYTTSSLNSYTIQPYATSANMRNDTDNFTLLGDTELSASERTRRLIPYMAFYVPVSELPINKQYISKHNIHATKQLARPSATGGGAGGAAAATASYIPVPPQYVHGGVQYSPPSAASPTGGQQHYHPNAGLSIYHTQQGYDGQQQKYNLVPPTTGHSQHLQAAGPPGPSAAALPPLLGHGNNAFVAYKQVNPIRQKTVQYFPPLTSTASSALTSASASVFENIKQQTSSFAKQQQKLHYHVGSGGSGSGISGNSNNAVIADAVGYRPRAKQSKINLTPFTPSNTVPGSFVPIVYTPVNSNNNNNNNNNNYNLNSHNTGGDENSSTISFNQEENQQYHKHQHQQHQQQSQQYHHQQQQPQQIALEYSSGPLPPSGSAASIPIDVPPQPYHHSQQQPKLHNPKQHSQFYGVTTSPVNVHYDAGGDGIASGNPVNPAHHSHHNAEAISPPIIYHQNQHRHQQQQQQQQLQPEHVIIDSPLRTSQQPQTVTLIGSQQQQQQQMLHGSKSTIHFQPPKPESFFESEIQVQLHQHQQQEQQQQQRQHQQQHNIDQVLKDVNSYSIKNSQMLTPQEKYVMYLQQRMHYNKHQQRHHATRYKNREHHLTNNNNDKEPEQHQYVKQHENLSQNFISSSTIRPSSQPSLQYDSTYPQHSPTHHELYPRPELKPSVAGTATGAEDEEQILTIPVHSLFSELETIPHHEQRQHNHYSQSHSAPPSSKHKSQHPKNRPSKPQYIDYIINEPKQSLDDEQQQQQQHRHHQQNPQQQVELLKPTLGPPSHAFILVTTAVPLGQDPAAQENYGGSSLRPAHKIKPKLRLQPVVNEQNVNHHTISEETLTDRPNVESLTPTTKSPQHNRDDEEPKYVYMKEEFGQKLPALSADGAVKLKPLHKYGSDGKQIPQSLHQQEQQQHYDDVPLQPLAPKHNQHNELQANVPAAVIKPPKTLLTDPNELPDIRTSSLAEILHKLQESNHLPHTLTPDNIDNSIKTLIRILKNLKQTQTIVANPPQHHEHPSSHTHPSSPDYDYTTGSEEDQHQHQPHDLSLLTPTGPNKHPGPSTGRPGIDYPNYADIPQTSFDCSEQRYKGFFGDPETNCQVWHYCDLNGGKASFLCPNGTIFSQIALTCDWWFNVKCATTAQLYVLNERLYKYILPFTPKFPEDYSGPIVDKYLAMKFQEMEDKMRIDKEKALQEEAAADTETEQPLVDTAELEEIKEDNHLEETTTAESDAVRHVKSHSTAKHNKHESVNSQVSEQSSERNLLIDDEVDDISQRGTVDNFESTTIPTLATTKKPDPPISFSLKPIIVSSTVGPDYDDDPAQHHENEKRSNENPVADDAETEKTERQELTEDGNKNSDTATDKSIPLVATPSAPIKMQITVEKVDVIEIKPDGPTGHLIRDMLLNTKQTDK